MSKIISIGTAVPDYKHEQKDIFSFMKNVHALTDTDTRKLQFLYKQAGIDTRYSAIPDYSLPENEWKFYQPIDDLAVFPLIDQRMKLYKKHAAKLSIKAIENCIGTFPRKQITHLITVSCTGMSAPGLDIELLELLQLSPTTTRTSVNFMGCYAAIHALKIANAFCTADEQANVLIVCTELCTLHFQQEPTMENMMSSMLFADGSAAVLVTGNKNEPENSMGNFYSMVATKGSKDMAWDISSKGFLMTLSSYIPNLIEEDFNELTTSALAAANLQKQDITHWCIHPGGKKILEAVHKSLHFSNDELQVSYDILKDYGNMSSPTILFVLQKILDSINTKKGAKIFIAAFGPGLTMETFILTI